MARIIDIRSGSNIYARIRLYDRPETETMKKRATLPRLCSLFVVSLATTGESATATHETVYSKVVHPSLSVHDSAADYIATIAGSSVYCNRVLKYRAHDTHVIKIRVFSCDSQCRYVFFT